MESTPYRLIERWTGPILNVPSSLRSRQIRLRAEEPGDFAFLEELYWSVRWDELEPTGWPDTVRQEFLRSQHGLQHRHYATYYPGLDAAIIMQGDLPIGRLYLHRGPRDHRIVDISLLPAWRAAGIGTALLRAACEQAATAACTVSIHVEKFNPALRLYRRLGFEVVGESGPYYALVWRAGSQV